MNQFKRIIQTQTLIAVDSSDSDSASSSSSREDETVIETKKHKIKAKHTVDKKRDKKHGVKCKYEEQIIGEVCELKKLKSDMQKKGKNWCSCPVHAVSFYT